MILCDSGPIFAAADRKSADHRRCVDLFTGLRLARRTLLLPPTVVAEVGYLLESRIGVFAEVAFLRAVSARDFQLVDLVSEDFDRIADLVEQYADLPLGTTDASVIALAERLDITGVATLDRRHFSVVRPRHVDALKLVPE
ncbi:MAG: PIN domain-containing protein [Aeromicrobium sp.]|uniref:type II toxin-antitoxin system VapC family toxin n=1 Tax=Aeromicrobium sp. TaxID=1871063 RepID=UPI0039E248AD